MALEELEELPSDGPLQAPADVSGALALGPAPSGVGAGLGIVTEPCHRDGV